MLNLILVVFVWLLSAVIVGFILTGNPRVYFRSHFQMSRIKKIKIYLRFVFWNIVSSIVRVSAFSFILGLIFYFLKEFGMF